MAARFTDGRVADRILSELRTRFGLGPADASLAPLGGSDQPHDAVYLLAGRFEDSRVEQVRRIVEGAGGTIVADVDEGWTRPREHHDRPSYRQRGTLDHQPARR